MRASRRSPRREQQRLARARAAQLVLRRAGEAIHVALDALAAEHRPPRISQAARRIASGVPPPERDMDATSGGS